MKDFDKKWKEKLDKTIEQEISNANFSLRKLVSALSTSSAQLYRRVKKLTGESPSNYVRKKRLHKAKKMLEDGVYSTVSEVAIAVGFRPSDYFSVLFEKEFGKRPVEYLREAKRKK